MCALPIAGEGSVCVTHSLGLHPENEAYSHFKMTCLGLEVVLDKVVATAETGCWCCS